MKYIKFLYYKWIKRECPHICKFCAFKNQNCINEILDSHK